MKHGIWENKSGSENGQLPQANHQVLRWARQTWLLQEATLEPTLAPTLVPPCYFHMAFLSMNMVLNRSVTTFQIIFLLHKIVLHIIGSLALMPASNTYNHFGNFPNQINTFQISTKSGARTY